MAFSTDRFEATGVQLTGDELRFQRLSAPTHPTGYVWEEKQVKCKVKKRIREKKNVQTIPVKQFIHIHQHQQQLKFMSDTVFHFATRK